MQTKNDSVGARLTSIRGDATRDVFAPTIGVSKSTLQRYENNETVPDGTTLLALRERYRINPDWLLTGAGAQWVTEAPPSMAEDLRLAFEGDQAAARRHERAANAGLAAFSAQQRAVAEACAHTGYKVPRMLHDALVLALMYGMSTEALTPLLSMLETQERRDIKQLGELIEGTEKALGHVWDDLPAHRRAAFLAGCFEALRTSEHSAAEIIAEHMKLVA